MGEGTTRVEEKPPRQIEREIEHLRTRLDRSLAELDRRRHELTDVRLQVRKHPAVAANVPTHEVNGSFGQSAQAQQSSSPFGSSPEPEEWAAMLVLFALAAIMLRKRRLC